MPRTKKPSSIAVAARRAKDAPSPSVPTPNLVDKRISSISDTHKRIKTQTFLVNPSECRIWERHNRNFDRLNEENCADLIESFISSGEQEIPAIVRPVNERGQVKYEIIAGARRFWTVNWLRENNYPSFLYRIEVRNLTDEEAFRISNLENLDRQDISDYERAVDYKNALDLYYHGKQVEMAKRLNKSESWVSRYLTLAQLPIQIPTIHRDNEVDGAKPMSGAEVFKRLKAVGEPEKKSGRGGPVATYGPGQSPHLSLKSRNQNGLNLYVPLSSGAKPDEIVRSFRECLKDYYEG